MDPPNVVARQTRSRLLVRLAAIMLVAAASLKSPWVMLAGLLAVAFHELAHVLVARWHGLQIKRLGVTWRGVYIVRQRGRRSEELCTALAGPAINLALASASWGISPTFALANLIVGTYNMVPLPASDGLRVWRAILPRTAAPAVGTVSLTSGRKSSATTSSP